MIAKTITIRFAGESGHAFELSEAGYFVPDTSVAAMIAGVKDQSLVTVFMLPRDASPRITLDWLLQKLNEYGRDDDVYNDAFLSIVIFSGTSEDKVDFTDEARDHLKGLGNEQVLFVASTDLLPGPYFAVANELRDVWKLIEDTNRTCMTTLKPQASSSDPFEPFRLSSGDSQSLVFALQSKIKARAEYDSPLAGLRMVVKDNIDLKGLKTSNGNKAFYDLYPPRAESAECIQKLISQGVVIAGKTKMNSFGNWEEPLEYIDYQAPWNPRADRYQSTGGSSSGSAAAVASYGSLDFAIGTDTWASVTRPALWCGCYGFRPSLGAVSSTGIEPFCQVWDTAGILARDLQVCKEVAIRWLSTDALEKEPKPFSSVIWPIDFWSIIDSQQTEMSREFANKVKTILGLECDEVSFDAVWERSPPPEANGLSLHDFIHEATGAQCYDAYHNFDDFRAAYRAQFGHSPYVSPPNQKMWSFAKTISKEKRDQGFERMKVYTRWVRQTILVGENSNPIIIMPIESMRPRYRDESPTFRRPPQDGVNALGLAPVMDSPILTVPISEIEYLSRITEQQQKLPLAVSIMSNPGTDLSLLDTVHAVLTGAGLPTTVKTGQLMFD